MDRPYIFCHMFVSLDGKIMGNYMDLPACEAASDLFYSAMPSGSSVSIHPVNVAVVPAMSKVATKYVHFLIKVN